MVNSAALRIFFALAAHSNWNFIKCDIKTAFFYGELEDEIFMRLPEGYKESKHKIRKLRKHYMVLNKHHTSGTRN